MAGIILKLGSILLLLIFTCNLPIITLQQVQVGGQPAPRCVYLKRGACPGGWRAWGNSCYKTLDGIHSWKAATTTACTEIGGWLAVPNNEEENAFILSMSVTEGVWINCNDVKQEGDWECIEHGQEISNINFWGNNEPNNVAGNENCAVIEKSDGRWHDVYCDNRHFSVVCKRPAPVLVSS